MPQRAIEKSETEWRASLSPEQYWVLREGGTEPPFSGEYWSEARSGVYACAGCGQLLFRSEDKLPGSGGWPCFASPVHPFALEERPIQAHGMRRIQVVCQRCGGILGHRLGPREQPRYVLNSSALSFALRDPSSPAAAPVRWPGDL